MCLSLVASASLATSILTTYKNIREPETPYGVFDSLEVPSGLKGHEAYCALVDPMVRQIQSFAGLEENWDGEGALPVIEEVRENAMEAIRRLYKIWGEPDVNPSFNGTVIFEWHHVEVEFYLEIGKDNFCFLAGNEKGYRNDLALSGKLTESSYSAILTNGSQLWAGYPQENISTSILSSPARRDKQVTAASDYA
jgi:hypothetical protein